MPKMKYSAVWFFLGGGLDGGVCGCHMRLRVPPDVGVCLDVSVFIC
jgi:hypothetical protein